MVDLKVFELEMIMVELLVVLKDKQLVALMVRLKAFELEMQLVALLVALKDTLMVDLKDK
jgi:hypothetical protein